MVKSGKSPCHGDMVSVEGPELAMEAWRRERAPTDGPAREAGEGNTMGDTMGPLHINMRYGEQEEIAARCKISSQAPCSSANGSGPSNAQTVKHGLVLAREKHEACGIPQPKRSWYHRTRTSR